MADGLASVREPVSLLLSPDLLVALSLTSDERCDEAAAATQIADGWCDQGARLPRSPYSVRRKEPAKSEAKAAA